MSDSSKNTTDVGRWIVELGKALGVELPSTMPQLIAQAGRLAEGWEPGLVAFVLDMTPGPRLLDAAKPFAALPKRLAKLPAASAAAEATANERLEALVSDAQDVLSGGHDYNDRTDEEAGRLNALNWWLDTRLGWSDDDAVPTPADLLDEERIEVARMAREALAWADRSWADPPRWADALLFTIDAAARSLEPANGLVPDASAQKALRGCLEALGAVYDETTLRWDLQAMSEEQRRDAEAECRKASAWAYSGKGKAS